MMASNHSQEIVRNSLLGNFISLARSRIVLDVSLLQVFINIHDSCQITTSVAVVRSREDRRHVFVMSVSVTLNFYLNTSIIN